MAGSWNCNSCCKPAVFRSQVIITGTFSIIKQCSTLGCFLRVKNIHTSPTNKHGQIYIPKIKWTLMSLCLAFTIGLRDTKHISNASVYRGRFGGYYGDEIKSVTITKFLSCFLVVILVWEIHGVFEFIWSPLTFLLGFKSISCFHRLFRSSNRISLDYMSGISDISLIVICGSLE